MKLGFSTNKQICSVWSWVFFGTGEICSMWNSNFLLLKKIAVGEVGFSTTGEVCGVSGWKYVSEVGVFCYVVYSMLELCLFRYIVWVTANGEICTGRCDAAICVTAEMQQLMYCVWSWGSFAMEMQQQMYFATLQFTLNCVSLSLQMKRLW